MSCKGCSLRILVLSKKGGKGWIGCNTDGQTEHSIPPFASQWLYSYLAAVCNLLACLLEIPCLKLDSLYPACLQLLTEKDKTIAAIEFFTSSLSAVAY